MDLASKTGNAGFSSFDIPHGSITLQLNITDDEFKVHAPFLNISGSKRIPLLRKVTELNFSPLNLSSIFLDGDQLAFRYSSPISLCEPYRTYDALREICIYADSYDDEFINKFNASWIRGEVVFVATTTHLWTFPAEFIVRKETEISPIPPGGTGLFKAATVAQLQDALTSVILSGCFPVLVKRKV